MRQDEIRAMFDHQAAGYDTFWVRMAPVRDCLYFILDSVFAGLPVDARILCIGVGTGAELAHLARKNPEWRFTVVEPSDSMLDLCRQRAENAGFASRCHFHGGYLDSLAGGEVRDAHDGYDAHDAYDAATCFLVSHFILDEQERSEFFGGISRRLKPGGILASSDLCSDVASPEYQVLLPVWARMMGASDNMDEAIGRMTATYARDVGVLAPGRVASIIESGGFESSVQVFQAGMIHAWVSRRAPGQ